MLRALVLLTIGAAVTSSAAAHANDDASLDTLTSQRLMQRLAPNTDDGHELSLQDRIAGHLYDYGNSLGSSLDALSIDMLSLHFDARNNSAKLHIGGGNSRDLVFAVDSNISLHDDTARVVAHVDLGIAGYVLHLDMPTMDLASSDVRGERSVEIRLPLLERRF